MGLLFMNNYSLESYFSLKLKIDDAISRVLNSGNYILGEEVSKFETEFSNFIGCNYAVGVGNGTDAINIALRAGGIKNGDEVITVSHTAVATVTAIELAGAVPVLIDIEPARYTLNPDRITEAITSKTRAVVAVHLYGHPANIEDIKKISNENNLLLIEDCAQAHGAKFKGKNVGNFGDISTFSFYPTKNLGTFGDGGIIVTNSLEIAETSRAIRQYGWKNQRNNCTITGVNSRLDEIHAAILRAKLPYLERFNKKRQSLANIYDNLLNISGIKRPQVFDGCEHVYHQYVIETEHRNKLQKYLMENGFETQIHYPIPIHLQDAYKNSIRTHGPLNVTDSICHRIISLPIHPFLSDEDVIMICKLIERFYVG